MTITNGYVTLNEAKGAISNMAPFAALRVTKGSFSGGTGCDHSASLSCAPSPGTTGIGPSGSS